MNIEHVPSLAVAIEEIIAKSNMKRETFGMEDNIKKLNSFHEFQSKIKSKLGKSEDVNYLFRSFL